MSVQERAVLYDKLVRHLTAIAAILFELATGQKPPPR